MKIIATRDEVHSRRRATSDTLRRISLLVSVATMVAGLVPLSSAGASGSHLRPPASQSRVTTRPGVWRLPTSQSHAPTIPIAGGAAHGQGGFNGVSCPTPSECVAVGADDNSGAVVSSSKDGGGTWKRGLTATGVPTLNAVDCPTSSECVAVGQGVSVRSLDAGATWKTSSVPTANTSLLGVSCPTPTLCVTVGVSPGIGGPLAGQLLVTLDGGTTWKAPTVPSSVGALGSVDCPSATFCVAVGASIVVSFDGGLSWTRRDVSGGTGVLRSVSCVSATSCVAVGPNPIVAQDSRAAAFEVVTSNGGLTWNSVPMPAASASVDVVSCSLLAGCRVAGEAIAADPAVVLKSSDGRSWSTQVQVAGAVNAVSALACPTASDCVYVGRHDTTPVSLKSTNGSGTGESPITSIVRSTGGSGQ